MLTTIDQKKIKVRVEMIEPKIQLIPSFEAADNQGVVVTDPAEKEMLKDFLDIKLSE